MFRQFKLIFLAFLALDLVSNLHNLKVLAACPKKKCQSSNCPHEEKQCPAKNPTKDKSKQICKEKNCKEKCQNSGSKTSKSDSTNKKMAIINELGKTQLFLKSTITKLGNLKQKVSTGEETFKTKQKAYS